MFESFVPWLSYIFSFTFFMSVKKKENLTLVRSLRSLVCCINGMYYFVFRNKVTLKFLFDFLYSSVKAWPV